MANHKFETFSLDRVLGSGVLGIIIYHIGRNDNFSYNFVEAFFGYLFWSVFVYFAITWWQYKNEETRKKLETTKRKNQELKKLEIAKKQHEVKKQELIKKRENIVQILRLKPAKLPKIIPCKPSASTENKMQLFLNEIMNPATIIRADIYRHLASQGSDAQLEEFKRETPSMRDHIATFSRGVSSLAAKEKLGLIILEYLKIEGRGPFSFYHNYRGWIIYDDGKCHVDTSVNRESKVNQFIGPMTLEKIIETCKRHSSYYSADAAFNEVFKIYNSVWVW